MYVFIEKSEKYLCKTLSVRRNPVKIEQTYKGKILLKKKKKKKLLDVSEMPQNKSLMWFNKFWRKTVRLLSDQNIVFVNVISFRGCPFFSNMNHLHAENGKHIKNAKN